MIQGGFGAGRSAEWRRQIYEHIRQHGATRSATLIKKFNIPPGSITLTMKHRLFCKVSRGLWGLQ